MEWWSSFANPRAYTAAPMAATVAVYHAVAWAFSHHDELSWGSLGIVVPDLTHLEAVEPLRRLQRRGVQVGTLDQAEVARHVDRVLITYTPDEATLARVEALEEARVVVAIGDDSHQHYRWVNQHHPVHLGGTNLTAAPPTLTPGASPVAAA